LTSGDLPDSGKSSPEAGESCRPKEAIAAIKEADLIIAGPGDLYSTLLPVLLIPDI